MLHVAFASLDYQLITYLDMGNCININNLVITTKVTAHMIYYVHCHE